MKNRVHSELYQINANFEIQNHFRNWIIECWRLNYSEQTCSQMWTSHRDFSSSFQRIKKGFLNFCVGVEIIRQFFRMYQKMRKNIHIFWYWFRHRGWRGKMVLREKTVKKWKLRGLRLSGLMWNQMSTPCFIYENDQHKKLNILSGFENKIPTHMVAIHAISKSEWKFRNRIPEELDQKLVWDNSLLEMLMIVLGHQLQVAISTRR